MVDTGVQVEHSLVPDITPFRRISRLLFSLRTSYHQASLVSSSRHRLRCACKTHGRRSPVLDVEIRFAAGD